ncbi:MAG: phosphohydrolase [Thermodesulfobacteriota bacterium]
MSAIAREELLRRPGEEREAEAPGRDPRPRLPAPDRSPLPSGPVPDDAACERLWDRCAVPDHIRRHSARVADAAAFLAERASAAGLFPEVPGPELVAAVRASALLHDLAKDYCIRHGGSHAQLGAAWTLALTGSPALAHGVLFHVWWPWDVDPLRHFLPLAVLYADKRVRHSEYVSLGARFTDLFERYGSTPERRDRVRMSLEQTQAIEHCLSEILGVKLHAHTFDSRRLVA